MRDLGEELLGRRHGVVAFGRIQLYISGEAGGAASGKAMRLNFAPLTFSATRAITSAPGQSV